MKLRRYRAFTLVEIMIVVGIIGILIAIAVPGWIRTRHVTRGRRIQNDLVKIDAALQQYMLDFGVNDDTDTPPSLEVLRDQGYFQEVLAPPISGTAYVVPASWDPHTYPTWDGDIPSGYEELYRHPNDE